MRWFIEASRVKFKAYCLAKRSLPSGVVIISFLEIDSLEFWLVLSTREQNDLLSLCRKGTSFPVPSKSLCSCV